MVVLYVSRSSIVKFYIGLGISDLIFLDAIIIRLSSRLSFTAIQFNRSELIMCQQFYLLFRGFLPARILDEYIIKLYNYLQILVYYMIYQFDGVLPSLKFTHAFIIGQ